jgi:tetratricopeptide (TPR) repeat protein
MQKDSEDFPSLERENRLNQSPIPPSFKENSILASIPFSTKVASNAMSELSIHFHNNAVDAAQAGNFPEALTAVERALSADPSDHDTWQLYIIILNSLGRTEDAEKASLKLSSMGGDEVKRLLIEAEQAANTADAIAIYQSAIALDPKHPEIYPSYALALMNHDDVNAALSAAETGVRLAPNDAMAHYAHGHILRLMKKKESALAALIKAVALDPNLIIALYEQGMILSEKGQYPEALAKFEKVLKAYPGDPGTTTAISNIKAHLKQ